MESKLKHLELIQGVVNRLATESFRVKGWTVVLVTALFVLLAMEDRLDVAYIALAPVLVFWGLDGYYLWQERLFRALYDHVRVLDEKATPCAGRRAVEASQHAQVIVTSQGSGLLDRDADVSERLIPALNQNLWD